MSHDPIRYVKPYGPDDWDYLRLRTLLDDWEFTVPFRACCDGTVEYGRIPPEVWDHYELADATNKATGETMRLFRRKSFEADTPIAVGAKE